MADVKKINGYAIKDEFARQIANIANNKFLIDDFCKAAYNREIPVLNAWFAARTTVPGLIAIESSNLGGIPLDVPDFGDAPEVL